MNRAQFVETRRPVWDELRKLLDPPREGKKRRSRRARRADLARVPELYRCVCRDLALARHRDYPTDLVDEINELALRGHQALYGKHGSMAARFLRFVAAEFPREVRANARLFWICMLLFWGPFSWMVAAGFLAPEWISAVLPMEQRAELEQNFGPQSDLARGRPADVDLMMFGFYIFNNVGIDFRVFAGGVLFGLGTLFFTLFNGVYLGAAFGYMLSTGNAENFLAFTAGHGSFELMAVVISAMGGLKLGLALVAPGQLTRRRALRERGAEGVRLLFGAALMTTCAAVIEGFWSPSSASHAVKYVVGAALWALVLAYLAFAGRERAPR